MFDDKGSQSREFMRPEAPRASELDRIQPELRGGVAGFDVDVRRFRALQAIEEEAKTALLNDSWHETVAIAEMGPIENGHG